MRDADNLHPLFFSQAPTFGHHFYAGNQQEENEISAELTPKTRKNYELGLRKKLLSTR
jgi:hypothetical protein